MLDVKNLLKFSSSSQAANGKQPGQKTLVNLQGIEPFYAKKDRFDRTLIFESRFESGNLAAALKVSDDDYYLALQNDVNTSGNTQWFFFRVQNTRRNHTCTFNIMNFTKPDSLFNFGMKVSVYSEKMAGGAFDEKGEAIPADQVDPDGGRGWFKGGERISYY